MPAAPIAVAALLAPEELRAASFIVTLYGDVVEPRGGLLWMGTLVEVCGLVGISETRVRTAVSRLVAAGRLEGTREGRRSYYRLTEAARREFAEAVALVFAPPPRPVGWLIAAADDAAGEAALAEAGFVALGAGLMFGADAAPAAPDGAALVFGAELAAGQGGAAPLRRPSAGTSRARPRPMTASSSASRRSRPRSSRRRRRKPASSPGRCSSMPSAASCCATRGCPPRRCRTTGPSAARARSSPTSTPGSRRGPIRS